MLALITLSGNYWVPSCDILNGVSKQEKERGMIFRIYPTCTEGKIKVEMVNQSNNDQVDINVYNSIGKRLTNSIFTTSLTVDLSRYPEGIYLVSISTDDGKILGTQKVFKK
jgi:hypothetical protein